MFLRRRLGLATCLALACIFVALGTPLEALRMLAMVRTPADKAEAVGSSREPTPAMDVVGAQAPFATRIDAAGRERRVYFPRQRPVGSPEESARQILGLAAERLKAGPLELARRSVLRSPSGTHVRFQQAWNGIPIWGAEAVVSFDAMQMPTVVASDLEDPSGANPSAVAIDSTNACERALAALAPIGQLLARPHASLWLRQRQHIWRLEQRVAVVCTDPAGDWEVWIDAATGAVLEKRDRTVYDNLPDATSGTDAAARVFLPDPCLARGDPSFEDQADADAAVPEAAYASVTLRGLQTPTDGWYRLVGPWARLVDWESPWGVPDSATVPSFVHSRSQQGFEDAMVYYHIDNMQRWYRDLGFTNANAVRQVADPHGMNGADNSKFVPSLHKLSFGEGGVDDGEDAEVIDHEYGHATQFDIVPTWGTGGHAGAMGEGFGDYLANSYAWSLWPQQVSAWNGVFQWDGHNQYWAGRRAIDTSLLYPRDAASEVHRSGTLWCSALTDALYGLADRPTMDRLVIDHHYALTGAATMADAANAILAADVAMHHGAHLGVLVETFARWGLVDATNWQPVHIDHVPLDIATRAEGAPHIVARVTATAAALDPQKVVTWVRSRGGAWLQVPLAAQGGDDWQAVLPMPGGENVDLEYYIEAQDAQGNVALLPAAAPQATCSIAIGRVAERFETNNGWLAGLPTDGATSGRWVRATPIGTSAQPSEDHTANGTACFVTGNGLPGAPAGDADVDGGATTLLSPVWDLHGVVGAKLSYWRWFTNDQGASPDADPWTVDLSNDGGATWIGLENTVVSEARWRHMEFDLMPLLGAPDRVRLRFMARDVGAASLVEGAVDDVLLQVRLPTDVAMPIHSAQPRFLSHAPNPCNPGTTLRFALDSTSRVRLCLYDARGRRVRDIVDATYGPGEHAALWDGCDARGQRVASGIYVAWLVSPTGTATRKLVVVR